MFIYEVNKIFEVTLVTWNDRVQLASYQLMDVAHKWYAQWKENPGTDPAPTIWYCFIETFRTGFSQER